MFWSENAWRWWIQPLRGFEKWADFYGLGSLNLFLNLCYIVYYRIRFHLQLISGVHLSNSPSYGFFLGILGRLTDKISYYAANTAI